ncbi:MAG: response regulator transcription factor [Chloroflexota bacterium]
MSYILAVDDEIELLGTLNRLLSREGHEVVQATSGSEAWQKIVYRRPDLIILDVMMPGMSGLNLCQQLRADGRYNAMPILFLTARNNTDDVIAGLDAGGDDYVMKPFEMAELTARVRALLRRNQAGVEKPPVIEIGRIKLDSDTYQVTIDDNNIQLTATEHRLLRYLMEHANQALSPQRLLEAVWDYPPHTGDPDLVRAHIRNLRAKLERDDSTLHVIRTIHGVGYMIVS